ncbi:hypothetical protein [Caballeronia sp. BR00000012568055]|uniref:hypothetical protein n=1 Tax=Caballeronia sp. BR00000012568055 TaxID=2918761 RepID=UPI0023F7C04A|nr:hypothetical protein [Caballeronia sp. BR00000012568055]
MQTCYLLAVPSVSAADPTLPLWESLMRQAVADERAGQLSLARAGYERALAIALRLLDAPPPGRAEDCLAALVVSHHNLADLLADSSDSNDRNAAARHLCHAHETLIALHTSIARPVSLRQAALRHSRETHMALVRHVARHGPHPLIARTLDAACMTLHADSSARH